MWSKRVANQPIAGLCDSGSADLVQNNDGTQGTIIFSDCLVTDGNGEVLSGAVIFSGTVSGSTVTSLSIQFINFVVTQAGQTQTVNMTITCDGNPLTCNFYSDFVGLDGRIYRVQVTSVTNLSGTSFVAVATVFDPEHGSSTINASLNYNNCPGNVPVSGTITITGAAVTTATVVYNDCDSFNVTHMGISTNYLWADIL